MTGVHAEHVSPAAASGAVDIIVENGPQVRVSVTVGGVPVVVFTGAPQLVRGLFDRARTAIDIRPNITCPRCGVTSWHPEDVRQGYCGRCHDWTSEGAQ